MRENAGQVMDEILGWQEVLTQKTRSWPVLAQGMRVLIGLMLIALLMHLFTPGGPFWVECALRAFYIGLTALCYFLLRHEQRYREQCLAWVGDCLAQVGADVPGLLARVEVDLRRVQRQLGRLQKLYYTACLVLAGYLVNMVWFLRVVPLAEFLAIPLLLLLLVLALWPAHRLRNLHKERACVAHLQQALLPQTHLPMEPRG
jgi:hypothetical protein